MNKIHRIINTAMTLANANAISQPEHVDAIIGAMTRKSADGLPDDEIYSIGRQLAKKLADAEHRANAINQLIASARVSVNPLVGAYQAL